MSEFTNQQIDLSNLPDWQDVEFESLSYTYRYVILFRYATAALISSIVAVTICVLNQHTFDSRYIILLGAFLLLLIVFASINIYSMRYYGYAVREHDILYRSGIFSKTVEIVPFKHIQHINVNEGVFSRIFGLSSIDMHTAGSELGISIVGLESKSSNKIQEFVLNKINTQKD